ncbi:Hypothetical predicted protein [Mytilus galloprovincialis]|uniref:Uncharacterized protein n=1 Tax=Mytilus galloprovincialis TaxID=29158 RepID=A0A8B6CF50_MYTGA|nr:Hypothetical predicted protein [Mytilus galloprovincialis]
MVFRTKAKEVREDPFKGMSPDEAANIQINIISNSCALLHSLGYEIAAIAAKDTEPSHVFGSPKGLEFIQGAKIQNDFRESVFGDRHKFSRYEIAPTCQMCNQEPEDLTHMRTTCSALSETRKETFNPIKIYVTKFIGERKWKETFNRLKNTVLIIDCTNFTYIFSESKLKIEELKCSQEICATRCITRE